MGHFPFLYMQYFPLGQSRCPARLFFTQKCWVISLFFLSPFKCIGLDQLFSGLVSSVFCRRYPSDHKILRDFGQPVTAIGRHRFLSATALREKKGGNRISFYVSGTLLCHLRPEFTRRARSGNKSGRQEKLSTPGYKKECVFVIEVKSRPLLCLHICLAWEIRRAIQLATWTNERPFSP